ELPIDDLEDRICPPSHRIALPTPRGGPPTPLVGEDDFGSVAVEGGRMPVREVRISDFVDTDRIRRIRDVEQDAVARAGAGGEIEFRVDGDVVAGVGLRA